MKSSLNWQDYQTLELISSPSSTQQTSAQQNTQQPLPRSSRPSFANKARDFWHKLLVSLSATQEPHVWQDVDASGVLQWKAYDPTSGRTALFYSETEMRAWLEELHYGDTRLSLS